MTPTNDEILDALSKKHPMSVMAILHNAGERTTAQNEKTGEIIECYEYLGALFDTEGNRLDSQWIEQGKVEAWVKFAVVAVFLIVVVFPTVIEMIG